MSPYALKILLEYVKSSPEEHKKVFIWKLLKPRTAIKENTFFKVGIYSMFVCCLTSPVLVKTIFWSCSVLTKLGGSRGCQSNQNSMVITLIVTS